MDSHILMDLREAVEALQSGDSDLRLAAARELGRLDDPGATAPLAAALDDPDPAVTFAAAVSVIGYGTAAIDPLFDVLRRRSRGMLLAERCLTSIEGSAAFLLEKLETSGGDILLRAAILRILVAGGDVSIVTLVIEEALEKGDLLSQYAAAKGISRLWRQLEVELLGRALLESVHDKLREEAGRAMVRRSDSADMLFKIAMSRRLAPAACAFKALVSMKGTADETLLKRYREGDTVARTTAARVFTARGEASAVYAARDSGDFVPVARPASTTITISTVTEEQLEAVLETLDLEKDPEVLLASARALIDRGATPAAMGILERVITTAEGAYRQGAVVMLSGCGLAGLSALVNVMKSYPQERWTAALSIGDIVAGDNVKLEILPALARLLENAYKPVKWAAAYLLAKTMYPPAVAALREALAEGDTRTRRMAVEAIVDIGGEGCEEELSLAAELDADPAVRLMAGVFTGSGGTTGFKQNIPDRSTAGIPRSLDTLPGLLNRLSNAAPEVRAFAASILGQAGKREAAPGLFELLFDEDERVVIEARRALDSLPT